VRARKHRQGRAAASSSFGAPAQRTRATPARLGCLANIQRRTKTTSGKVEINPESSSFGEMEINPKSSSFGRISNFDQVKIESLVALAESSSFGRISNFDQVKIESLVALAESSSFGKFRISAKSKSRV
jgi:hypothetical protein